MLHACLQVETIQQSWSAPANTTPHLAFVSCAVALAPFVPSLASVDYQNLGYSLTNVSSAVAMSSDEEDYVEYEDEEYVDSDGEHPQHEAADISNVLLEDDMLEVKSRGYFVGLDSNRIECSVWVGFPLSFFTKDLLFACGLDHAKSVAVKLVFTDPPVYGSRCPTVKDKHIFIRQTTKRDFSTLGLSDCEPFGLWWTLEQRLSEYLQQEWKEISLGQQRTMERLREREKLASSKNIKHLMEIHAVSREVAKLALVHSNNHLDCATDLLFDEKKKLELQKEGKNSAAPQVRSVDGINMLLKCLHCVQKRIEDCTRFCIVCDKPHPLQLLKPTVCSEDLCNFQFTNMGLGINIENEIVKSPQACDLLIRYAEFVCTAVMCRPTFSVSFRSCTGGHQFSPLHTVSQYDHGRFLQWTAF